MKRGEKNLDLTNVINNAKRNAHAYTYEMVNHGYWSVGDSNLMKKYVEQQTVKDSVYEFLNSENTDDISRKKARGVDTLVSPTSGRQEQTEVVCDRYFRTVRSQRGAIDALNTAQDLGTNLVWVDAHEGSRPSHATWQGHVYSITGGDKKYPNLAKSTGYGTMLGLCGVNCRHTITPWFDGWEEPDYAEEYRDQTSKYNMVCDSEGEYHSLYDIHQALNRRTNNIRKLKKAYKKADVDLQQRIKASALRQWKSIEQLQNEFPTVPLNVSRTWVIGDDNYKKVKNLTADAVVNTNVLPSKPSHSHIGYEMNHEEANTYSVNKSDDDSTTNCQTCTFAYWARRQGYNVHAKSNSSANYGKGGIWSNVATENRDWLKKCYVNPNGSKLNEKEVFDRQSNFSVDRCKTNKTRFDKFKSSLEVKNAIKGDLCVRWKTGGSHSVACYKDVDGEWVIYDGQRTTVEKNTWKGEEEIGEYLSRVSGGYLFETTGLVVNPEMLDTVCELW